MVYLEKSEDYCKLLDPLFINEVNLTLLGYLRYMYIVVIKKN